MIAPVPIRRFKKLILKIGVSYCFFLVTYGVVNADNTPIVFQSTDTPPYWSASLPNDGFGGTMFKLLSDMAGIPYSISYLPIKRFRNSKAIFMIGDPDLLIDQKPRAIFPFGVYHSAFFYYRSYHNRLELNKLNDLKGYKLGVLRGTLEDKASFTNNGIIVEEANSELSLLRMLVKGRIDLCILVVGTGEDAIRKFYPQERDAFAISVIPKLSRPLTVMIDLSATEGFSAAKRYQKVLTDTINSQKYHEILENHYGQNNIPADREDRLNRFIQQYSVTWGN